MTDDALYAPGGRLPDHLRAAVILAGGSMDQFQVWFSPERRDGVSTLDVARMGSIYTHLDWTNGPSGHKKWKVYAGGRTGTAERDTAAAAVELLIKLHTGDAQ